MITTVLFDLDGTLLPMDNDEFTRYYFNLLAKKMAAHGFEPEELIKGIWIGKEAMVNNDGSKSNEEAFWEGFTTIFGSKVRELESEFLEFYKNEFNEAKVICSPTEDANKVVKLCKEKGLRVILATSPIFPRVATCNRIKWAGLDEKEFDLVTTYENMSYCKPNVKYYEMILKQFDLMPQECLMVGNDVEEDMVAKELGMDVFLLDDYIINRQDSDITQYEHGGFVELIKKIERI